MGFFARLLGRNKSEKPVPVAERRYRVLPRSGQLGLPPTSQASTAGVDEIDRFTNWGEKIFVTSTNVQAGQYDIDKQELMLWFLNGSVYLYSDITPAEAISFITAPSKGSWVWNNLRVAGTADKHRKPFVQIA